MGQVPDPQNYSWPQYRLFVVHEMERIADTLTAMEQRIRKLETTAAKIAAMTGLAGAALFHGTKFLLGLLFGK